MNYSIKFYIGRGFDSNGQPIPEDKKATILRNVQQRILTQFDGFTCTLGTGGWKTATGENVIEDCAVLEVIADAKQVSAPALNGLATDLAFIAHQSEVLVTITSLADVGIL